MRRMMTAVLSLSALLDRGLTVAENSAVSSHWLHILLLVPHCWKKL